MSPSHLSKSPTHSLTLTVNCHARKCIPGANNLIRIKKKKKLNWKRTWWMSAWSIDMPSSDCTLHAWTIWDKNWGKRSVATVISQIQCVREYKCMFMISPGLCMQWFRGLNHADSFTVTAFPAAASPACRRNTSPACLMVSDVPIAYSTPSAVAVDRGLVFCNDAHPQDGKKNGMSFTLLWKSWYP